MSNRRRLRGSDWEPFSRRIRTVTAGREDQLRIEVDRVAPGFLDQLQAASAEGGQLNREFRRNAKLLLTDRCTERVASELPGRLQDQITGLYFRVITELATGERKHCGHIDLARPRPAVACVHADIVYCTRCFTSGKVTRPELTDREEHTCDLCGTYKPGQTMDGLNAQVGPVMLIIGIGQCCRRRLQDVPATGGAASKGTTG